MPSMFIVEYEEGVRNPSLLERAFNWNLLKSNLPCHEQSVL